MKVTTISGSTYEINQDSKKIRRLNGSKDPTPRQGPDGQWRSYSDISPIKVGSSVVIFWDNNTALLAETEEKLKDMPGMTASPSTMTSMVASIEP